MMELAALRFQKILVFDSTDRDRTGVAIVSNGRMKKLIAPVRAQDLQKLTEQLLLKAKTKIVEIDAIAVKVGPGSYTGTRMGVAAANTLGWLMNLPLIALEGSSLDGTLAILTSDSPKAVTQVTALY